MMDLQFKKSRVRYLVENVTDVPADPDRGRLLMTLLYWKVFDGIDIPEDLMREIVQKASNPESLGRITRFVLEDIRNEAKLSKLDVSEKTIP